jgi:L-ribulose-5-phosphate 3-epimerase
MNRRSFLTSSTLAVAGSALSQAPPASAPKRKLRKAMMLGTVRLKTASLLEKFQAIKAAGFEGVEPGGGLNENEVTDALKATGLECASVCCHTHWKQTLTHSDATTRKAGIEGVLTTLRNAKAYGTDSILVVPGVVDAEVSYDVAWKRSQEAIREAIPLAKELQVRISIENVWNAFLLSPLEMARYVDEFDSPWVAAHFDIGNVLRIGWPEQWIKILGKRITRLHFKEFSIDRMRNEGLAKGFDVDFLTGSNNWPAIMKALDEIGYTGWCISEQRMGINPGDMAKLAQEMDKMFVM